jgi:heat-inducible transcriptional repressor
MRGPARREGRVARCSTKVNPGHQSVLGDRIGSKGLQITIGAEHGSPALTNFTVVTSEYRVRNLRGVIGVIGPTRMPYERVIALVESTSNLVSEFLA